MAQEKIRVWFNHWFSTVYDIINLLKEGEDRFYIISTNQNPDAVMKEVSDEFYVEPQLHGEDYVNYCLDFCRSHKIQIFIPRKNQPDLAGELKRFQDAGVRVLMEPDETKIRTLNDKRKTCELFEKLQIGRIPPYRIVTDADAFEKAYWDLKKENNRVCFKFVQDEGGMSFRVVDDKIIRYQGLFSSPGRKITLEQTLEALREQEHFPELMVMPYLDGKEISVDCLNTAAGLIAIPREKGNTRVEKIVFPREILETCDRFFEKYGLYGPCNIQFRYDKDTAYLLEVNTRMSGGVQLSCVGTGVNIPKVAVCALLGEELPWSLQRREQKVSYVEMPVVLSDKISEGARE